ncbi:type I polyketide synthase [Nocardiopsis rhodophaea]|uniref:type I polyketide synthase n=1 Tax=Nocardiopsis rhodophaea TaxID=280238 RepID=UPI0031DE871A
MKHSDMSEIAVVGMGCRFPRANGVSEFWDLLEENIDAVTLVPEDRFDVRSHHTTSPGEPGRTVSQHGGFIDDLYGFDAGFFGISPREAQTMDPQQRLLLHVVWEALEDAGIVPSSLAGSRTGVFVGQATSDYADVADPAVTQDVHGMVGSRLRAVTAGRVSFALDLRGPSLMVDTACSSSLVAVHMARQSLLTGESGLAIAGGVNAVLSPSDAIAYAQGEMLSPDGRCKFADNSANGFVRSEGVGAVVLKRLSDAVRDGDPVLAVLRGSAVTNDGKGSGLLLKPAVSGQVEMVRAACQSAGVTPAQLDYVEAHGTGTQVGDDVELRALAEAVRSDGHSSRPLRVGSIKSNIGHTEATAGIAGLIKAVLIAQHRIIPASLHLSSPHPLLTDSTVPIDGVTHNTPVEPAGPAAVLGVSSFGLSGTNAHVIVGEYVPDAASEEPPRKPDDRTTPSLLVLSARTSVSLRRLAERYAAFLEPAGTGRDVALDDICHAAARRREAHPYRLWSVGRTHDELAATLRALAAGEEVPDGGVGRAPCGEDRKVAFVFPGQGSQWIGMGQRLLATDAAFRRVMSECDAAIDEELGWSVVELLTTGGEECPSDVAVVQPLLWAMEVSLAALLRDRGIDPDLCLGHSMGEAAAACVSGGLSLRDAAAVICRRSRLMRRLAGHGAMLAVELGADEAARSAAPYGDIVGVAAENAPRLTVLAGDPEALRRLAEGFEDAGVWCRFVKVNVASHSPGVEELRGSLLADLGDLAPVPSEIQMFSSAWCAPLQGTELDAAYWMDNLRERVRFVEAVQTIAKEETVFVEVSPHPVLVQSVAAILDEQGAPPSAVATLKRQQDEYENIARALGRVFAHGGRVDWGRWFSGPGPRVRLPLYAWDTQQFRREPVRTPAAPPQLLSEISLRELGLDDFGAGVHARGGTIVPPVVYVVAVLRTARELVGTGTCVLEDVEIGDHPLDLMRSSDAAVRVTLTPTARQGVFLFEATARPTANGAHEGPPCLSGRVRLTDTGGGASHDTKTAGEDKARHGLRLLDSYLTRCTEYVPAAEFYRRTEASGYTIDHALRTVAQLWRGDRQAVARMSPFSGARAAALEAGLLVLLAAWPHSPDRAAAASAYVPVSFGHVRITDEADVNQCHWVMARFTPEGGVTAAPEYAHCDVALMAANGKSLAEFRDVKMRRMAGAAGTAPVALVPAAAAPTSTMWPMPDMPRRDAPAPAVPAPRQAMDSPGSAVDCPPTARTPDDVLKQVATVLGVSVSRIDPGQPLRALGLDSLLATELRVCLHRYLGIAVSPQRLLGGEPVRDIIRSLADQGR